MKLRRAMSLVKKASLKRFNYFFFKSSFYRIV